ncbi:MAG: hypothetical protein ACOCQB_03035 [Halanaerobiaceae bacterium]
MDVEGIYQKANDDRDEIIYELGNSRKIIKRKENIVKKLNLNRWEEVNFIPGDFKKIERNLTAEEEEKIRKYLAGEENDGSVIKKIKKKICSFVG